MKWDFLLDSNMIARLSIKKDGPQFSNCIFGVIVGAENGVTDPEGYWTGGMIGTLKKTFIMAGFLARLIPREV
jgi:hypothetical protein